MMTDDQLHATLQRIPEPDAPATLEATVMARIQRLPTPAADPAVEPLRRRRERSARAWAATGLMLVLGLYFYEIAMGGRAGGIGLSPSLTKAFETMPAGDLASVVLFVGLLLYAAGLFAQVSAPRRRRDGRG